MVGIDRKRAGTCGRIMVMVGVGIDTRRARDLGKDHGYGGGGKRYSERRCPGEG